MADGCAPWDYALHEDPLSLDIKQNGTKAPVYQRFLEFPLWYSQAAADLFITQYKHELPSTQ